MHPELLKYDNSHVRKLECNRSNQKPETACKMSGSTKHSDYGSHGVEHKRDSVHLLEHIQSSRLSHSEVGSAQDVSVEGVKASLASDSKEDVEQQQNLRHRLGRTGCFINNQKVSLKALLFSRGKPSRMKTTIQMSRSRMMMQRIRLLLQAQHLQNASSMPNMPLVSRDMSTPITAQSFRKS